MTQRTALIMAGGTGGHIMPALAVADALRDRGWTIQWLGTVGKMENELVPGRGYPLHTIHFEGIRGRGLLPAALLPFRLLAAMGSCWGLLRRLKPNVVLGFGGYASFPGGLSAWLLGRPVVAHEQNSVLGLSNRVLSLFAKRLLTAFPSACPVGGKVSLVGNPVRQVIAELPDPALRYAARTGPLRVLVVGGSLGATVLNERVPLALAALAPEQRPQVIHQSGAKQLDALIDGYSRADVAAQCVPFIDDMAQAYADADLVICRAGALTVAELAAAGVASVLVPFPHAVDDHQTGNARYLADAGAAILLPQRDLTPERLAALLRGLDRDVLQGMASKARRLAKTDATAAVAAICEQLAG